MTYNSHELLRKFTNTRNGNLLGFILKNPTALSSPNDFYVLTLPLGDNSKLLIIEKLLPHASDTLFLAWHSDQTPNRKQIDREKLDDMMQMSFDLLREEVEKLANNREFYSVSSIDLDSLVKDGFLFR